MPGCDIVLDAQLLGPFGIDLPPHHIAGRTGGNNRITAGLFHGFNILSDRLLKDIPLAGHQHGCAAAVLLLAQVGEIHAGLIQQPDAGHGDIVLHIAGGAAGKIDGLGLVRGTVLFLKFFGKPVGPVLAVTGPDIAFLLQGSRHHLKGREGHLLLFVHQLAAQLHPGRLDGQRSRTAEVAEFAGGADQECVHHRLVPLLAALHILPQPVPFAPRALALPAPAVKLVAFIDTVAALGAAVGIPGHVSGNIPDRLRRALADGQRDGVPYEPE